MKRYNFSFYIRKKSKVEIDTRTHWFSFMLLYVMYMCWMLKYVITIFCLFYIFLFIYYILFYNLNQVLYWLFLPFRILWNPSSILCHSWHITNTGWNNIRNHLTVSFSRKFCHLPLLLLFSSPTKFPSENPVYKIANDLIFEYFSTENLLIDLKTLNHNT